MLTSGGDEDDLHADRGEQVFFYINPQLFYDIMQWGISA